jgi:hypothetical protein
VHELHFFFFGKFASRSAQFADANQQQDFIHIRFLTKLLGQKVQNLIPFEVYFREHTGKATQS